MFMHGSWSLQLFPVVWIFLRSLGVIYYGRCVLRRIEGLVFHDLKAYLCISNQFKLNELWPYYQQHVNQIILNHTTLWSIALQIFEAFVQIALIVNLSLNQTLLTFLLCEPNLYDSIDSGNFSMRSYLRKDSGTHMHGLAV